MKKFIWQIIAYIVTRWEVRAWLIKKAKQTPYFHLTDYMDRWWLMPRCLLTRHPDGYLFPRSWLPFSIRIHHIKRPDAGRDLHDHPFDYRTIILFGWYVEEDVFGQHYFMGEGDTKSARAQTFHRIVDMPKPGTSLEGGGVWTLFIMGRRINSWGFIVGGRKVHWKKYVGVEA
jgi:hypothetical protein